MAVATLSLDPETSRRFFLVDGIRAFALVPDAEGNLRALEPITPPSWLRFDEAWEAAEALDLGETEWLLDEHSPSAATLARSLTLTPSHGFSARSSHA